MMTKAYHSFQQRMIYFSDDIELTEFLRIKVCAGELSDDTSTFVFKNLDPHKFVNLSRRTNSDGSRQLLLNHLRQSVYGSYIKDVYEEVTSYFREIIYAYFKCDINSPRVIGEHSMKMDSKELLSLGDWDSVCQHVANSVLQSLEAEKSTIGLLNKIKNKIGIDVEQQIIDSSIPYLQVRHFLVHADGVLTNDFMEANPAIAHNETGKVILDFDFYLNFKKNILNLIRSYDEQIIAQGVLHSEYLAPQNY